MFSAQNKRNFKKKKTKPNFSLTEKCFLLTNFSNVKQIQESLESIFQETTFHETNHLYCHDKPYDICYSYFAYGIDWIDIIGLGRCCTQSSMCAETGKPLCYSIIAIFFFNVLTVLLIFKLHLYFHDSSTTF